MLMKNNWKTNLLNYFIVGVLFIPAVIIVCSKKLVSVFTKSKKTQHFDIVRFQENENLREQHRKFAEIEREFLEGTLKIEEHCTNYNPTDLDIRIMASIIEANGSGLKH